MSSNRGRRRNNGNRGGDPMPVDSAPANGVPAEPATSAAVELRNWERGTLRDVTQFLERRAHVRIANARQNGGVITFSVSANEGNALQSLNGVRFCGASLNIKVTTQNTAVQILTGVLDARYDARLEMLNFSLLMSDPELSQHGMLKTESTAMKMFQALAKLALTKTGGKVQSVTLEGNSLVNGEVVLHLATVFPNLQNLSLANNQIADIGSLEMLRNRLPMLRELVLAGNPVQQLPNYEQHIQELMRMFRRLMVVDGVAVRAESELPSFALPVTPTFFEDEAVAQMTPMFLANFFGLWDTNRAGLLQLYDDLSLFSVSWNGSAPHIASSRRMPPNPYIDASRNLLRNSGAQARRHRVAVGGAAIEKSFTKVPPSRHDLNDVAAFAIDAWKLGNVRAPGDTAVIMVVHGQFVETSNNQTRSFDRTLVVLPGPNNSYVVASDMLNVRPHAVLPKPAAPNPALHGGAPSPSPQPQPPLQSQLQPQPQPQPQPHLQPQLQPQLQSLPHAQAGLAPGAPGAPQAGMDAAAVVQEVMRRTHLKAEYADMCARQANYQLDAALQLFEQFRAQLPPDAFA